MVGVSAKRGPQRQPAPRGRPRKREGAPPSPDQMRRLQFIERAVMWTGKVGRRAVATTFDVSIGHVTHDFQRYREMAPRNLAYDVGEKCFRPTDAFKPVFEADDPTDVLRTIAATAPLSNQDRGRLLGFALQADIVHPLPVAIDRGVLVCVCRAITAAAVVGIDYQSMNTPAPVTRDFAPHALIFTGQRWLVRGWDGRHDAFRDLALGRILRAKYRRAANQLPRDDLWHDRVTLELGLAEGLSPGQAEVTAREFGMVRENGCYSVRIDARQAMVPYVLDHLRLRPSDRATKTLPLQLSNYAAVKALDRPEAHG